MSRERIEQARLEIQDLKKLRSDPAISNKTYLEISSKIFGLQNRMRKLESSYDSETRRLAAAKGFRHNRKD